MSKTLDGIFLGQRPYAPVHQLMMDLHEERRQGRIGDTLLLLEHEPVITLGRGAKAENLLLSREELAARGISLVETGRGGDVTLHAPGQLIAYPIIDLSPDRKDVRKYVQALTRIMKALVKAEGIDAGTIQEFIGLWLDLESPDNWPGEDSAKLPAKIGAIGVRISRWITSHGFALNLSTDLSLFDVIVPCGIRGRGVTSLKSLTGSAPLVEDAARKALDLFAEEFGASAITWNDQRTLKTAELHHSII